MLTKQDLKYRSIWDDDATQVDEEDRGGPRTMVPF
jgi:hypothetical protein